MFIQICRAIINIQDTVSYSHTYAGLLSIYTTQSHIHTLMQGYYQYTGHSLIFIHFCRAIINLHDTVSYSYSSAGLLSIYRTQSHIHTLLQSYYQSTRHSLIFILFCRAIINIQDTVSYSHTSVGLLSIYIYRTQTRIHTRQWGCYYTLSWPTTSCWLTLLIWDQIFANVDI